MLFHPRLQRLEHKAYITLIADEIVIDEEDTASPTEVIEALQFCKKLLGRFCSGFATVENNNVAKLTLERTSSRELDRHIVVGVHLQQVVPRDGSGGDIWFVARAEW